LPIDPDFQRNRKRVGEDEGIAIWGSIDPPKKLGIRGTYVAVDWTSVKVMEYASKYAQCSFTSGGILGGIQHLRRRHFQLEKMNAYNV